MVVKIETKICLECGKEFKREKVLNNWGTYKIEMAQAWWDSKKYCSKKCGRNYIQRTAYHKDNRLKDYAMEYNKKNKKILSEKKRMYHKRPEVIKRAKERYEMNKKNGTIQKRMQKVMEKYRYNREKIFKKYDYKCAICGFNKIVYIHHIKESRERQFKDIKDYIVLCPNHHLMYHKGLLSKEEILKHQK